MNQAVIDRLERLKTLTVAVKAGRAIRKIKVVRSAELEDLVFQSLMTGAPMRDNNILTRFIKPAGRKIGLDFVNWRLDLKGVTLIGHSTGGGVLILVSCTTLSFLITTPEAWVPALGDAHHGFPYLSGVGRLIAKDFIYAGRGGGHLVDSAKLPCVVRSAHTTQSIDT